MGRGSRPGLAAVEVINGPRTGRGWPWQNLIRPRSTPTRSATSASSREEALRPRRAEPEQGRDRGRADPSSDRTPSRGVGAAPPRVRIVARAVAAPNRAGTLTVRRPIDPADGVPSELWRISRCRGRRIVINPGHEDFPALLAEALDAAPPREDDPRAASEVLGCTPTQLPKLLEGGSRGGWALLNEKRRQAGRHPLR